MITLFIANIPSLTCFGIAAFLAYHDNPAWWFFGIVGALFHAYVDTKKGGKG